MECTACGEPTGGASRCPACQRPPVGQPRGAPEGSSNRMPETGRRAVVTNAILWGAIAGALVIAVIILAAG